MKLKGSNNNADRGDVVNDGRNKCKRKFVATGLGAGPGPRTGICGVQALLCSELKQLCGVEIPASGKREEPARYGR